jgi:hypothetical protein
MEVSRDKKSMRMFLDSSPLFFHVVSKLVQALVVTYDELFCVLVIEGDVLFLKPFPDPIPPTVQP